MRHISLSNKIVGTIIVDSLINNKKISKKDSLLVSSLPIFHLLDSVYYMYNYSKSIFGGKNIVKLNDTGEFVARSTCLQLARSHFKSIFSTVHAKRANIGKINLDWDEQRQDIPKRAITYYMGEQSRLGDNLTSYILAKWISHKYKIPFIFREFPHSDELALHQNQQYSVPRYHPLLLECRFFSAAEFEKERDRDILWQIPFPTFLKEEIDWNDSEFRREIIQDLSMINSSKLPPLVPDRVNIALHYRQGGSFDKPDTVFYYPTKVPPKTYFNQAVQLALNEYRDKPVHIQLFTDSRTPEIDLKQFQDIVQKLHPDCTISTASDPNSSEDQVTSDMIAMSRYECIVRADSGLSKQSSLIGKPSLEIEPQLYRIDGNTITIDGFTVIRRDKEEGAVIREAQESVSQPISFIFDIPKEKWGEFHEWHTRFIDRSRIKSK